MTLVEMKTHISKTIIFFSDPELIIPQISPQVSGIGEYAPTIFNQWLIWMMKLGTLCFNLLFFICPFSLILKWARFFPIRWFNWIAFAMFRPLGILRNQLLMPFRVIWAGAMAPVRALYQMLTIPTKVVNLLWRLVKKVTDGIDELTF